MAYQNIYANKGNMTAGTDGQTIDAMSLDRISRIVDSLKDEKYIPNHEKKSHIRLEMCYNVIWIFVAMNTLAKRNWNGNIIQKTI